MAHYSITLERSGDIYVDGWNVYYRKGKYPTEDGDGGFVQYVSINPYETEVSIEWTPPDQGTYHFGATTVYSGVPGKFQRLTGP
jgi:hypothetical protein